MGIFPAEAKQHAAPAPAAAPDGPHVQGEIWVEVGFARDGAVKTCRVVRSNAPYALEVTTIEHIRKHWKCPLFAGDTTIFPIYYADPPASPYWNGEMPPPPDLFPLTDPQHDLKLRISFGGDSWPKDVQVVEPSGFDSIDQQVAIWVRVHWHSAAYANKVVEVPFVFKGHSVPPPVQPPPPVPPEPPEQVPIPAVRAE